MNHTFVNWETERKHLTSFLGTEKGVLHVVGGSEAAANLFINMLVHQSNQLADPLLVCRIDPNNAGTNNPHSILRSIARTLKLHDKFERGRLDRASSVEVMKDIRGRTVNVHNNQISVAPASRSEEQEFESLVAFLRQQIDDGLSVRRLLIVFQCCHEMKDRERKSYFSSLWTPLLAEMIELGARAIFQFSKLKMALDDESIPPKPTMSLELPTKFGNELIPELAELALSRKWEDSDAAANAFARALIDTSSSVSDVYARITAIELKRPR